MRYTHKILWAVGAALVVCVALAACAGGTTPSAPGILANDPAASAVLQRGHQIYITDCAECHRARDPRTYSRQRWDAALPRMEGKARLSSEDRRSLEAYIAAVIEKPAAAPAK